MSYFTEEALDKFQEMCAEGIDFGEEPAYDFAMCLKADGDIYGVTPGERCDEGKHISDAEAKRIRGQKATKEGATRMAKLRAAFIKKVGREMTPEETKKAMLLVNKGK